MTVDATDVGEQVASEIQTGALALAAKPRDVRDLGVAFRATGFRVHLELHRPVPVMGDRFERGGIVLHLTDRFADRGLAPKPGTIERGKYHQWIAFSLNTIEPAAMAVFFHSPEGQRGLASPHWPQFEAALKVVEDALEHAWLLGEAFSAADVLMGSMLEVMSDAGMLATFPRLTDYVARLRARPKHWPK